MNSFFLQQNVFATNSTRSDKTYLLDVRLVKTLFGDDVSPESTTNFSLFFVLVLGDRPSSQMSFLEQFLKESTSGGRSREPISVPPGSRLDRSIAELSSASGAGARRGYSVESDEGDVEDNRAVSNASSRSNMSELSAVSLAYFCFHWRKQIVSFFWSSEHLNSFIIRVLQTVIILRKISCRKLF